MKIILHIGTHKTGSSSIQNFMATNVTALGRRGFSYAIGPESPRNVNFLGNYLALGHRKKARDFLRRAEKIALRRNCHTLILSAESFYAMTAFFYLLQGESVESYWSHERENIQALRELLPPGEVRVICYLRRQDVFLESLYNQMVKQPQGITCSIDQFRYRMEPMLDYSHHLRLWADVFGTEAVRVRCFDDVWKDLIGNFFRQALGIQSDGDFPRPKQDVNARLNMDVLEVKRILNRIPMSKAESYMIYRAAMKVSEQMPTRITRILSPEARDRLIESYVESNMRLCEGFLSKVETDWLTVQGGERVGCYAGLSVEKAMGIFARINQVMRTPRFRFEKLVRAAAHLLSRRVPGGNQLLRPLRRLYYLWFLKVERGNA